MVPVLRIVPEGTGFCGYYSLKNDPLPQGMNLSLGMYVQLYLCLIDILLVLYGSEPYFRYRFYKASRKPQENQLRALRCVFVPYPYEVPILIPR